MESYLILFISNFSVDHYIADSNINNYKICSQCFELYTILELKNKIIIAKIDSGQL